LLNFRKDEKTIPDFIRVSIAEWPPSGAADQVIG
jgi:hypothetical protein